MNIDNRYTTMALGEEGSNIDKRYTTMAIGEEGGNSNNIITPNDRLTTMALGEEGSNIDKRYITMAVGEEGEITTFAVGEEGCNDITSINPIYNQLYLILLQYLLSLQNNIGCSIGYYV